MRAIWKGAVSFGLVSVPVKLYSATESHDISFRQVHAKDGGRIKYQRVCSIDGEEVAYADIAKGYETDDGEMVILDDDDLAQLPANSSREISVEKFVPSDQIDPMMLEKSYYLEPEKSGLKPYALLRDALKESDRMAVVTVSLRTRMTPAVLRVRDDVLVLQTMMWPDEIRNPDFGSLRDVEPAKPQELKMAQLLLDTLAGDYDPGEFEDDYAAAVHALVEAKLEGGEVKRTKEPAPSAGEVVDLLAALQKSVAAAKTARGEDVGEVEEIAGSPAEGGPKKAGKTGKAGKAKSKKSAEESDGKAAKKPAKKASTKKAAAKKTPAKKTPAKKSAAKKSA
jgi:DNA end-binding protein Ku